MKSGILAVLAGVLAFQAVAEDKKPEVKAAPKVTVGKPTVQSGGPGAPAETLPVTKENVSYAVGMHFGNQMKRSEFEFNLDEVSKALKDSLAGGPTKMTDAQAQGVIQKWQADQQAKQMEKRKAESSENKKKGEAFLAENGKKEGIKTTKSGLQYQVIKDGTGKIPTTNDTVSVHYVGTLLDGKEFDSSVGRGQPAEFPVTGVIKGWTEALQLMKVGSKWKLFIPSDLAYGEQSPPSIPPNSVLVFEVELLSIKAPPEESAQAVSGEIIKVPSAEELKKGAKIEVLKEEDVKRLQNSNTAKPKN